LVVWYSRLGPRFKGKAEFFFEVFKTRKVEILSLAFYMAEITLVLISVFS
jgi:hypothetical protein